MRFGDDYHFDVSNHFVKIINVNEIELLLPCWRDRKHELFIKIV